MNQHHGEEVFLDMETALGSEYDAIVFLGDHVDKVQAEYFW